VDDVTAGEFAPAGVSRFRMADGSILANPGVAFDLDLASTLTEDGTSYPTTMLQLGVRCINDRIHLFLGYITLDELQSFTRREDVLTQHPVHNDLLFDFSMAVNQRQRELGKWSDSAIVAVNCRCYNRLTQVSASLRNLSRLSGQLAEYYLRR
jgi:hypothetical protein